MTQYYIREFKNLKTDILSTKVKTRPFLKIRFEKQNVSIKRTFVISDIHGRLAELKELLKKVEFSKNDMLIVLGDTIDKGNEGFRSLIFLMKILPDQGFHVRILMGNHEDMWYHMASKGASDKDKLNRLRSNFSSLKGDMKSFSKEGRKLMEELMGNWSNSIEEWENLKQTERELILEGMRKQFGEPRILVLQFSSFYGVFSHTANFKKKWQNQTLSDLTWNEEIDEFDTEYLMSFSNYLKIPIEKIVVFIGHIGERFFGIHKNYICMDNNKVNNKSNSLKSYCIEEKKMY